MPKKPRNESRPDDDQEKIFLRLPSGDTIGLHSKDKLAAVASHWNGRLASRKNWAGRAQGKQKQAEEAQKTLRESFKLSAEQLARIARSGAVEVSFPPQIVEEGQAALQVPWEYLISAGTKSLRPKDSSIRVTRQLRRAPRPMAPVQDALFIQNIPKELQHLGYTFDEELSKIADGLGLKLNAGLTHSDDETKDAVLRQITAGHSVIHFSGFDVFQIQRYLDEEDRAEPAEPGLALRNATGSYTPLYGEELCEAIASQDGHRTALFCFNCQNSGTLLAAQCVAAGVEAAIGVSGSIEDEVTEYFYSAFYAALRARMWNVADAFEDAMFALRKQGFRLHGSCLVLWTTSSALDKGVRDQAAAELAAALAEEDQRPLWEQIQVAVMPYTEINYSLLHNEQPVFKALEIRRRYGAARRPLELYVELGSGADSQPYRKTIAIERLPISLRNDVKLPLISTLTRSLRERLHSSLYVRIRSGSTVLHESSTRVTILPVDEWSDTGRASESRENDTRGVWLPSFVLPRDACVSKIINAARGYVAAIADDPAQGFDGYQGVTEAEAKRGRSAMVDAQVRAIWHAIMQTFRLGYINPPPSYSRQTQRLRTPSDVVTGGWGTCIDLTLLLAACLELIEIYPVIVLLRGHAFPGYWSSEEAYDRFVTRIINDDTIDETGGQVPRSWVIGPAQRPIILDCVKSGDLVAFDTVCITQSKKFSEAVDDGVYWLTEPEEETGEPFECMIDLRLARTDEQSPVTPLPIL